MMRADRPKALVFLLAGLLLILAGCNPLPSQPAATAAPVSPATTASAAKHLVLLYTNDEHGWLAGQADKNGVTVGGDALLMGRWRAVEGYRPGANYLVLSGGDMWTGPAISTWFEGDPGVEIMNAMGYSAAAVGNHDFDFGLDVLRRHASASAFPYLSANLVEASTGKTPDFAKPYTIVTVDGVRIALIGLTTLSTPITTRPSNVAGFRFLPYADAVATYAPQAQAGGADMIWVLGHVCASELRALAPAAQKYGVTLLLGGHCHERVADTSAPVPIVEAGSYLASYARVDVDVDLSSRGAVKVQAKIVEVTPGPENAGPDAEIAARVAAWQAKTDEALGEVIGYTKTGVPAKSDMLYNLVTDAWLKGYPQAQAALTNKGGFRQGLPPGPIRLRDVVGVLPFNNQLVDAAVTGSQLIENLACCGGAAAGVTYLGGQAKLPDGQLLDRNAIYHVLINDFMAGGGDSYKFGAQDPNQYFTGIDWRQPVIDYIRGLHTSEADPLEAHLDPVARTSR